MEYRQFGENKEKISLLGFGFMRLPMQNNNPSQIDDITAFEMVDYAISHGVNYFDTAYFYHEGKSELFVARALKKYPRESYYLADKLPLWLIKTREEAEKMFEEQLKKCEVDYFDNYLMHAMSKELFDKAIQLGIYDLLKGYQNQGKIKHLGFSFHDKPEVLELILNTYEWDFVQIQLNYLDWELQNAKKQYELIEAKGIQCIIMEPVRGGTLANLCPESNDILNKFSPNRSIASWAIRYAASLPNVLTVLSGMSNFSQVKDNIGSMSPFSPLSESEQSVLSNALEAYKKAQTVPCTGCRYCMDCPSGVDIPKTFKIINEYTLTNDADMLKNQIKELASENHPKNCTECGVCISLCPQSIEIPKQIKKAAELFVKMMTE